MQMMILLTAALAA